MKKIIRVKMSETFFCVLIIFHETTCNMLMWGSRDPAHFPPQEKEHFPEWFTSSLTPFVNGTQTKIPEPVFTPDYRIEEQPYFTYNHYKYMYEEERPYRMSPHHKQQSKFHPYYRFRINNFACLCTTVYRRVHLLAGCALLTVRHILTTATATEHVLRRHRKEESLEGILGLWYDTNANVFNSSRYMTPSRIHYHPKYLLTHEVNASHPIPCIYDLSVWALTYKLPGGHGSPTGAIICPRGVKGAHAYDPSTPQPGDELYIIGFQFIKAYRRKPMPWYKFMVKTRQFMDLCPKTEWGWFHCVMGDWARLGLDSGAGLYIDTSGYWRNHGLIGLNAFSMKLRSLQIVHYFTVLDTYPVLDFLYDAYLGRQKYEFLDYRFFDTEWNSPRLKPWYKIEEYHDNPSYPYYYDFDFVNY